MLMRKMFKVVRFSIDELAHLNAFEISKDTIPRKIETLAFFRLSECVFHVVCVFSLSHPEPMRWYLHY